MSYDETPEEAAERMGRLGREKDKRDEGMARAANNAAFFEAAYQRLQILARQPGLVFNSDEIHTLLKRDGITIDNPNAMGPVFSKGLREGVIVKVPDERPTSIDRGHGRYYRLYTGARLC